MSEYDYTEDQLSQLGDAIVWTAIFAAIHVDGVIKPEEKAEAVSIAHIRSFSTADHIKPFYQHLDSHFEKDFDAYSAMIPDGTQDEKELFVEKKIEDALSILPEIGPLFAQYFSDDLKSFFKKVFHADSSILQSFFMPVLTAHLKTFAPKK
jgi:hypothetical protein